MMRSYRSLILITFFFFYCCSGYAQLSVGTGLEYGTAIFVNGQVFAGRPSTGLFGELGYRLRERRFYPSFTYVVRSMAVPVRNSYFKGLDDDATVRNYTLRMNYRTLEENKYSLFFLGVGLCHVVPDHTPTDNLGYAINMTDTGSNNIYPVVQAGVKKMWRILPNSGFYAGLEGNVSYIEMHSQNAYYLTQRVTIVRATISGDIVAPAVGVKLEYFLGRSMEE